MAEAPASNKYVHLFAIAILVLGLFFYLYRIDRWFMDDDEGSFSYAAWRISEGEVPYRDFLTEQLPLFLYLGGALLRVLGRSPMVLRYATVSATLLTAYILYLTVRRVFGERVALISVPLFLVHPDVHFVARFFRAEPYMLLFSALGLYVLVCSPRERHRRPFLAGVLFGLAALFKLFAVLPAVGCGVYLLHRWLSSRHRRALGDLLAMAAGWAATVGMVFVAFQVRYPVFLSALFSLHLMQGAELSGLQVVAKGLAFLGDYALRYVALVLLAALGTAHTLAKRVPLGGIYPWQIPTAAVFLILSRSLMDRHLIYLVPTLCALAATSLEPMSAGMMPQLRGTQGAERPRTASTALLWRAVGACSAMLLFVSFLAVDFQVASREEVDTQRLAEYVRANTAADDIVLSDYLELNFHAQRRSTYLGAGLSGVSTSSGHITGAALREELERPEVRMVLINTSGGAHQMVNLRDYVPFRLWVQGHFALIRIFNRSGQTLEIYHREERLPLLPDALFGGRLALTGADLGSASVEAGQALKVALRWQVVGTLERDYTVSLRLLDENGHRYAQHDAPLLRTSTTGWEGAREVIERAPTSWWATGEVVLDSYALPVPYGTPPGKYALAALVYDLATGEVLRGQLGRDGTAAQESTLGYVEVVRPAAPPSVDELEIHRTLEQDLGENIWLLGMGPIAEVARPGDSLRLALFWQSLRQVHQDWQVLLRVQSESGAVVARGQFEPANAAHPTGEWVEGEVVLGQYELVLDRLAPLGAAQILLDLVDAHTGERLTEPSLVLASLSIQGQARQFGLPGSVQHPLAANLGDLVRLVGFDLSEASVGAGGVLNVTLYWEALAEMETSYTVFTHLLDASGRTWGQKDSLPVLGTYPTTAWLTGEVIADEYAIEVGAGAAPGEYLLEIGMYNAVSGERLPVLDGGGLAVDTRVVLGPVLVSP